MNSIAAPYKNVSASTIKRIIEAHQQGKDIEAAAVDWKNCFTGMIAAIREKQGIDHYAQDADKKAFARAFIQALKNTTTIAPHNVIRHAEKKWVPNGPPIWQATISSELKVMATNGNPLYFRVVGMLGPHIGSDIRDPVIRIYQYDRQMEAAEFWDACKGYTSSKGEVQKECIYDKNVTSDQATTLFVAKNYGTL